MKTPFLSSLMRLTANWKVVAKITAGFGSVIAVFIVVLALSFWNFVTIDHEVEEMESAVIELSHGYRDQILEDDPCRLRVRAKGGYEIRN